MKIYFHPKIITIYSNQLLVTTLSINCWKKWIWVVELVIFESPVFPLKMQEKSEIWVKRVDFFYKYAFLGHINVD